QHQQRLFVAVVKVIGDLRLLRRQLVQAHAEVVPPRHESLDVLLPAGRRRKGVVPLVGEDVHAALGSSSSSSSPLSHATISGSRISLSARTISVSSRGCSSEPSCGSFIAPPPDRLRDPNAYSRH